MAQASSQSGPTRWQISEQSYVVQESAADAAADSGTADAALELCALAPTLLQTGTKLTCSHRRWLHLLSAVPPAASVADSSHSWSAVHC